ncbi:MAG: TRAP transporter substrate-binding protein DctP [Deltaproteobacteria bacterium]|nr:TRAP transporter substrate-binding protein DctP [Deltaproteobacteria bacterium]
MNKKWSVIMSSLLLVAVLLAPVGFIPDGAAQSKPIEIKVAFGDSSASVFYRSILVPWGQELEAASKGRLKVTHFHSGSLGPANEHWDLAVKGLTDVSWQITLLSKGVFPLTDAITLPPTGIHSAKKMNQILWDLYRNNKYFQKEYQDAKVLFYAGGPPQWYWATKPIKTMADLKGLRLGSTGGPAIEAIKLHGGTPNFFLPMDMYMALQKGTLDGVAFMAEGVAAFKLGEIVKYGCNVDLCTFTAVVAMNHKSFKKLPDDLKKVVEEVSGKWSAKAGATVDESMIHSVKTLKAAGVVIYEASPEEKKVWWDALNPMVDKWIKTVDGLGMPGRKIMDEILALSKKY